MDVPYFHEVFGNLGEESGRALECLSVAGVEAEFRIRQVQLIFAAGDPDVEEPALLFEAITIFEAAAGREHTVGKPDEKDDPPLETLRLVQ